MKMLVKKAEDNIIFFCKIYGVYIFGGLFIGALTYFMMMSQNLVNDLDGIWHHSNFIAGDWEISLGRGLQRYADRARFGIVSEPFNSILTIFLIVIGTVMVIEKFQIKNSFYKGLLLIILVANPIVCNSLSYSYMSVNFGLAYFFSVAAFCCVKLGDIKRKVVTGILLGGLCLGISMAFYQAYICVTCVLITMYTLKKLVEEDSLKQIITYVALCLSMGIWGGVVYFSITQLLLYRAGVEMSSYRGASNINMVEMIKALPDSLKNCYVEFVKYISEYKAMSDLEFIEVIIYGLLTVYAVVVMLQFASLCRKNKGQAVLFAAMVGLLPISSCFVLLLAVGNIMTGLMSMGLLLCVVMLGVIVPKDGAGAFWIKRIYFFMLAFFAWFQLSAVENDQLALKEGKLATITLAENMVTHLNENGYFEDGKVVAFVGRPGDNDSFAWSTAYQMANGYAKFGCWSTDARNNKVSWDGVMSCFLGTNISTCGVETYQEIVALEQVANMPEFPMEGSVCIINNVIVVKVSDVY